jgi:hypothetical protein
MNLQLFVTDSTDFLERHIILTGVTKHIYERGLHYYWTKEEDNEMAQRFYVGDKGEYKGATYAIPEDIILSISTDERPMKFLPAGKAEAIDEATLVPVLFGPESRIEDVIQYKVESGEFSYRLAAFIREVATNEGCITLKDAQKRLTEKKIYQTPKMGEKVVKGIRDILEDVSLSLRK